MFLQLLSKSHAILQSFLKYHFSIIFRRKPILPSIFTLNLFGTNSEEDSEAKEKSNRYWLIEDIHDLLEEADRLYCDENYLQVYETLNRLKYQDNVEVQWRICRVLYKMCTNENEQQSVKESMIEEALKLISKTAILNANHCEVQKWMAIIIDQKSALDGSNARIKTAPLVHHHILKALEINPDDPAVLYMLGIWCYEISKLTWMRRQIAARLFQCPEATSTEDAYKYFLKAEQVKPRFFVGNIYMLGLCSYDLGMFFRARYYLKIAADLPIKSDFERKYSEDAKRLAEKLKNFEVNVQSLCH